MSITSRLFSKLKYTILHCFKMDRFPNNFTNQVDQHHHGWYSPNNLSEDQAMWDDKMSEVAIPGIMAPPPTPESDSGQLNGCELTPLDRVDYPEPRNLINLARKKGCQRIRLVKKEARVVKEAPKRRVQPARACKQARKQGHRPAGARQEAQVEGRQPLKGGMEFIVERPAHGFTGFLKTDPPRQPVKNIVFYRQGWVQSIQLPQNGGKLFDRKRDWNFQLVECYFGGKLVRLADLNQVRFIYEYPGSKRLEPINGRMMATCYVDGEDIGGYNLKTDRFHYRMGEVKGRPIYRII